MKRVAIELLPPEPHFGFGFVIDATGMEQVAYSTRVAFIPGRENLYFHTIYQARAFCWACGFTWSIKCGG